MRSFLSHPSRRRLLLLSLTLAIASAPLSGGLPELVVDWSVGPYGSRGAQPHGLRTVGDRVVFTALDDGGVEGLYRSDGTHDDTGPLGPTCGESAGDDVWAELGRSGSGILYRYSCPSAGTEIWRADGSESGIERLLRYSADWDLVVPSALWRGEVAFVAAPEDPEGVTTRLRVWTSDGTSSGTGIRIDQPLSGPATILGLASAGERLFALVWPAGAEGPALWASGTSGAGMLRIADLPAEFRYPQGGRALRALGSRLLLLARGADLWVSDGTPNGTFAATDLAASGESVLPETLSIDGGRAFFGVGRSFESSLWESDGTLGGTFEVYARGDEGGGATVQGPNPVVAIGPRRIFVRDFDSGYQVVSVHVDSGELVEFGEICPEPPIWASPCPGPHWVARLGEKAAFYRPDGRDGAVLVTDGTLAGTVPLATLCSKPCSFGPDLLGRFEGRLFLDAEAGLVSVGENGSVTVHAPDFAVRAGGGSFPHALEIARAGDYLLFPAYEPAFGSELHRVEEAPDSEALVRDLRRDAAGTSFGYGIELDGELVLYANGSLVATRGTRASTRCLLGDECNPDAFAASEGDPLWRLGELVLTGRGYAIDRTARTATDLFAGSHAVPWLVGVAPGEADYVDRGAAADDVALWTSDGTVEGTRRRATFLGSLFLDYRRLGNQRIVSTGDWLDERLWSWRPGLAEPELLARGPDRKRDLGATATTAYFAGEHVCCEGPRLVATDGTAGGTRDLVAFENGARFLSSAILGERLVFLVSRWDPPARRFDLWVSDGTVEGTRGLRSFGPQSDSSLARLGFGRLGDRMAFIGASSEGRTELWATDGTVAGTQFLDPLLDDGVETRPVLLASNGTRLYVFGFEDAPATGAGVSRLRLWTITANDSVAELLEEWRHRANPDDQVLGLFAFVGDRLAFVRREPGHGNELWTSDGTPAGTRRVLDLLPGSRSSFPEDLFVVGDALLFSADDGLHGRELWIWRPEDPEPCRAGERALCLEEGRFRVEAHWTDFEGLSGDARAVPLTGESGAFWFFDPANVELVAKVLDGRPVNDHHWVFYGALSNVRYALTVADGETGLARRYENPAGRYASVGDTAAFAESGTRAGTKASELDPIHASAIPFPQSDAACEPGPTRLCLLEGRFAVEVAWRDFAGHAGAGQASPWPGGESGLFWFFDPANVELIVKMVDGTAVNGRQWVYFGALSNVEYTVTVTDSWSGATRTYFNPAGRFASVGDVDAF